MSQRDDFDSIDKKERKRREKEEKRRRHEEKKYRKKHRHDRESMSGSLSCDWDSQDSELTEEEMEERERLEFTTSQLSQEAPINYRKLELILDESFAFDDLVIRDKYGKATGVIDEGKLVCRIGEGLSYGTRDNAEDFQPMDASHTHKGKRRARNEDGRFSKVQAPRNQDIVKSVRLLDCTTDFPGRLVATASVPAFASEAFYNESPFVNVNIMPGKLHATQPTDVTILDRSIKLETIDFQNNFPGVTPTNFMEGIMPCGSQTHWLVDANHPAVAYYNESPKGLSQPLQLVDNSNNVQMKKSDVRKYGGRARDAMTRAISYANVRDGFQLTFEAPLANRRRRQQQQEQQDEGSRSEGERRRGDKRRGDENRSRDRDLMSNGFLLGDNCNGQEMTNEQIKAASARVYRIRGRVEILYTPTDKLVEINMPTDEL